MIIICLNCLFKFFPYFAEKAQLNLVGSPRCVVSLFQKHVLNQILNWSSAYYEYSSTFMMHVKKCKTPVILQLDST